MAFVIALPAGLVMLLPTETATVALALVVYVTSVLALFGTSAAYHLVARTERAQRLMRRLDHSMIFFQIAGTYTPVCLLALPRRWGLPILGLIWVASLCGVAIKLVAGDRVLRLSNGLYVVLGCVAVAALPVIVPHLTDLEFGLLFIGGAVYTVGAILFSLRCPKLHPPIFGYHEVWHLMTLVAAAAHFGMVWSVAG